MPITAAEFEEAGRQQQSEAPRLLSFAVSPEDEAVIEAAVTRAAEGLTGPNRRGRALGVVATDYLESSHA